MDVANVRILAFFVKSVAERLPFEWKIGVEKFSPLTLQCLSRVVAINEILACQGDEEQDK
jgi:hypothetical protein